MITIRHSLIAVAISCLAFSLSHAEETPVPPEVKALAETFITTLKAGDEAAMLACWHPAEILAKAREEQAAREAGTSPTPIDSAKEGRDELKRQQKNLQRTQERAATIRTLIGKYFGDIAQLKFDEVDLDEDGDSTPDVPSLDEVEFRLTTADGASIALEVDSVAQIDGVWKFRGRLEDTIKLKVPEN